MNQVTLSRFWYGCDNGMTDFVVSRSRWKFWSYSQSLSTSNKTEKNILSRILCASFCTWYVIKIAKVYLCPIYYRFPPISSFVITLTFYSIHFHFDKFRIDFNSTKRFETKTRNESSSSSKKEIGRLQADRNFKIRNVFPWQRGGQTFKPWRKIQLSEFSVSSGGDVKSGELRKLIRPILDDASLNIPKKTLDKIPNENEQKVQHFY